MPYLTKVAKIIFCFLFKNDNVGTFFALLTLLLSVLCLLLLSFVVLDMPHVPFRYLGSHRYKNALYLLKQYTIGIFTKKQGFDLLNTHLLTDTQKRKIRRFWYEYDRLTSRPHEIVSYKNKEKLRAVQKASQHQGRLSKFKVAFLPTDGKHKPVVKYDKKTKRVFIKLGKVGHEEVFFNKRLLVSDPRLAVKKAVAKVPDAQSYKILCGEFEFTRMATDSEKILADQIEKMQNRYGNYRDWLFGIRAYYFNNVDEFKKERKTIDESREALKQKRKKERNILLKRKK